MKWLCGKWIDWVDKHPFWTFAWAMLPFMPFFIVYWCEYHNTSEYKEKMNNWEWHLGKCKQ